MNLGLVKKPKLSVLQRLAKTIEQSLAFMQTQFACRVEITHAVFSASLGLVHGLVSLTQKDIGLVCRVVRIECDSSAEGKGWVHHSDRLQITYGLQQPRDCILAALIVVQIAEKNHEFIASEPSDSVAGAFAFFQPPGHSHQELIAEFPTPSIVDILESVDIEAAN